MRELNKRDRKIIEKLKEKLIQSFSDEFHNIICFGSRLEGITDTDFDILLITNGNIDWRKRREISAVIFEHSLEYDIVFDTKYFSLDEYLNIYSEMPFVQNVKTTGIAV